MDTGASGTRRVLYHDGQLLGAEDLRDDADFMARRRALHVRASHGVWGVALGLEVGIASDGAAVQLGSGLAYDCAGREVVVRSRQRVDAPAPPARSTAPAWWFDLVVRRTMRGSTVRWSFAGDAPTPFIMPSGFADDVRLGEDIPLARVRLIRQGPPGATRLEGIDQSVRRVARGLVRPRVARGRLRRGSVAIAGSVWNWTVAVDTSAALFGSAQPIYFARLVQHPFLDAASAFAPVFNTMPAAAMQNILGPFLSIEGSMRTGFRLNVRAAAAAAADGLQQFPLEAGRPWEQGLPVAVDWSGIDAERLADERSLP